MKVRIIYLDTFSILGQVVYDTEDSNRRIEISEHVKAFHELHALCLRHEKEHARYAMITWRHLWLDLKGQFKLRVDPKLREQLRDFKKHAAPRGIKQFAFAALYALSNLLIWFALIPVDAGAYTYEFWKKLSHDLIERLRATWHHPFYGALLEALIIIVSSWVTVLLIVEAIRFLGG